MKNMASAREYFQAPPEGRYRSKITLASAEFSKAGAAMLHLEGHVIEPSQYAGSLWRDYIITDGGAKGGGMGKTKLRGLGIDVSTDAETPDEKLAQDLLGRELWIEYGNEPLMSKDANGDYTIPQTVFDEQLQKTITLNKLVVKAYFRHNVGASQPQFAQPQLVQQAPVQQYAQPVQQYAPQSFPSQPVQQYAQPVQQAFPMQQAPVQQGFAPQQGFVQQPFGNGTQGMAPPPWATQGPTQQAPEEGGKRRKKSSAE